MRRSLFRFFLKGQTKEIKVGGKKEMGVGNDDSKGYIMKTK